MVCAKKNEACLEPFSHPIYTIGQWEVLAEQASVSMLHTQTINTAFSKMLWGIVKNALGNCEECSGEL